MDGRTRSRSRARTRRDPDQSRIESVHALRCRARARLTARRTHVNSMQCATYPKIFGVGIRARIRSSSSTVTRLMPFLRQDSSTALTTIPRTNAGIFFMRAVAASSHAIVVGDSRPYSIAGAAGRFSRLLEAGDVPASPKRPTGRRACGARSEGETRELPRDVGAERIFGHQIAGHPVGPGAAAPAVAVHLALPASPAERGAAANVGEQLRGRPEVRETRAAKGPREDREVGARRDIAVRPYPHVVRPRRAPAGPSGVGPDRGQTGPRGRCRADSASVGTGSVSLRLHSPERS